jgi:ABC-type glycerol-3-phosphate transport system substrate-binding protein
MTVRRIAAAALVATLGLGFAGATMSSASAADTTWGARYVASHGR